MESNDGPELESVPEVELVMESEGNKRWLLAMREQTVLAQVRVPLHLDKLSEGRRDHMMNQLCRELQRKVEIYKLGDRVVV